MNIIIFSFFALTIIVSYARFRKKGNPPVEQNPVDIYYASIWNGTEVDRVYAWYRTYSHIHTFEKHGVEKTKMLIYAWNKYQESRKQLKTTKAVTKNGTLVTITHF